MAKSRIPSIVLLAISHVFTLQVSTSIEVMRNKLEFLQEIYNLKTNLIEYLNSFERKVKITLLFTNISESDFLDLSYNTLSIEDEVSNSYLLKVDLKSKSIEVYQFSLGGKEILIKTINHV
jgi:hypothetical protein